MIKYLRRRTLLSILSLTLVAALLQAQALGCCRLGQLFFGRSGKSAAVKTETPSAEHACCRKRSAAAAPDAPAATVVTVAPEAVASAPASHSGPCPANGGGCCLKDGALNQTKSVAGEIRDAAFLPLGISVALPREAFPASAKAKIGPPPGFASGPPVYLARLRILI